jgi:pyridoxine 5-phosphate synthase
MQASYQRLYVNIDHVATLRQARRGDEPDPMAAAVLCKSAGADGITAHLREDRRHIQDADIEGLKRGVKSYFNFECGCTEEMIEIALRIRPDQVTLVPERREEVTTEGGLDVERQYAQLRDGVRRLKEGGIRTSLFVDPTAHAVEWSHRVGVEAIELHTGQYALHADDPATVAALGEAAHVAAGVGIAVHAGHGLTVRNVGVVAAIPEIEELNIGHSIVSRAVFVGLESAVREVREAMDTARGVSGHTLEGA